MYFVHYILNEALVGINVSIKGKIMNMDLTADLWKCKPYPWARTHSKYCSCAPLILFFSRSEMTCSTRKVQARVSDKIWQKYEANAYWTGIWAVVKTTYWGEWSLKGLIRGLTTKENHQTIKLSGTFQFWFINSWLKKMTVKTSLFPPHITFITHSI